LRSRISSSDTSRGPTIDVFNSGSGLCRTLLHHPLGGPPSTSSTSVVTAVGPYRQHLPGRPSSTSSTSVVAAVGPCRQHPRGSHHWRLQLRWWPLSDIAAAPPGGPPSMSSTSVVAAARPCHQHPQGGSAIDVFNFGGGRCWTLPLVPPGGPPSTSPTSEPPAPAPPGTRRQRIS
jgi:hypothetical protein